MTTDIDQLALTVRDFIVRAGSYGFDQSSAPYSDTFRALDTLVSRLKEAEAELQDLRVTKAAHDANVKMHGEAQALYAQLERQEAAAFEALDSLVSQLERQEAERDALLKWCDLNPEWYARAVAEMLRDGSFSTPPNQEERWAGWHDTHLDSAHPAGGPLCDEKCISTPPNQEDTG